MRLLLILAAVGMAGCNQCREPKHQFNLEEMQKIIWVQQFALDCRHDVGETPEACNKAELIAAKYRAGYPVSGELIDFQKLISVER